MAILLHICWDSPSILDHEARLASDSPCVFSVIHSRLWDGIINTGYDGFLSNPSQCIIFTLPSQSLWTISVFLNLSQATYPWRPKSPLSLLHTVQLDSSPSSCNKTSRLPFYYIENSSVVWFENETSYTRSYDRKFMPFL
jgi:hypothetical protein